MRYGEPPRRGRGPAAAALLTAALALAPAVAGAQEEPAPVELEADRVEVDAAAGVSVYQGDAVLTRGALRITGDRMEVHTDGEGALQRAIVDGTPATYRDRPEGQPRPVHAEARHLEYYTSGPERAHLQGEARLWQGGDVVSAEVIDVDLEAQTVDARGGEGARARATLRPGRREEQEEER